MKTTQRNPRSLCLLATTTLFFLVATSGINSNAQQTSTARFIDLSLIVDRDYPCTWADGFPTFRMDPYLRVGSRSPYNSEILTIDGNTGTQMDVPPHSVARPELKLPHSGKFGNEFTDQTPAWKFVGQACVVDCRQLLNTAPNGQSSLIQISHLQAWETAHRSFRYGDVVLLRSDYSDKYYQPFPAGRRFIADPLEKKAPGWPDPHPDAMEYLCRRQVFHIGTDSPSMGPIPDLAEPTHYAALKHGAIFTEGATGLGKLPTTGAFYCQMGPKHKDGPYGESRAFAIVGEPLAGRLIESARNKRVLDLSVVNSIDHPLTWPGLGVGRHRHRYTKADFVFSDNLKLYHHTHIMDSHAGTHLVPPSYALPATVKPVAYSQPVQRWFNAYCDKYGNPGHNQVTTEKVPLSQTCGPARVIDVSPLVGTIAPNAWPASPQITVAHVKNYEKEHGALKPGDIVIFSSQHTDKHFKPLPAGSACIADPINAKSEGWPAPTAATIHYLADRQIRCIATDGPTLGGVDPQQALASYWAMGQRGIVGVEFLTQVSKLPKGSYFLFSAIKIRGCHGGPGRAIALY